jgi:hypothetical protein
MIDGPDEFIGNPDELRRIARDMADSCPLIVPCVHARLNHGEVSPGDAGIMLGLIELAASMYRERLTGSSAKHCLGGGEATSRR